ncbi:hypothetical protein CYMTET_22692 [Cymbomonas tetramitiformis]|uniref:HopJ type III effector protein n=1 Tax=Cymbomonas tetramitiformis TaxID=36881 RepID=A0AAE0FZW5_9CHLO|nr:hypothetical protein CYMTET_22692 [Cymbomonas tetramitiformis]
MLSGTNYGTFIKAAPVTRPRSTRLQKINCLTISGSNRNPTLASYSRDTRCHSSKSEELGGFVQSARAAALDDLNAEKKASALAELAIQEWGLHGVKFNEVMAQVEESYRFTPTEYTSGFGTDDELVNPAGTNNGSNKVFAFGMLYELTEEQTLRLFCQFFEDVKASPDGTDHGNIRNFMKSGWPGIRMPTLSLVKGFLAITTY